MSKTSGVNKSVMPSNPHLHIRLDRDLFRFGLCSAIRHRPNTQYCQQSRVSAHHRTRSITVTRYVTRQAATRAPINTVETDVTVPPAPGPPDTKFTHTTWMLHELVPKHMGKRILHMGTCKVRGPGSSNGL
nr:hypothetical protein CFP56_00825 [Quercus suber]